MKLSMKIKDNILIVTLKGELDHHSAESTRKKIDQTIAENNIKKVVLDLKGLSFMDSSGIGLVMGRYKSIKEKEGELLVVSDNQYIDRILKMSGLMKIIKVYPKMEMALNNI